MTYIIMSLAIFALGLIAVYAYFVIKNEFGILRYEKHAKKRIDEHLKHVVNASEAVLRETTDKMNGLLSQTSHFNHSIENHARMTFAEFKDRYVASLNSELAVVEKQYEEEFYQNMKELRKKLDDRFEEQMAKTDDLVAAFQKERLEVITMEVEEYKKRQEQKSIEELQKIFSRVLEDIIKKSMTKEDQMRLIKSSLELMKKDATLGGK